MDGIIIALVVTLFVIVCFALGIIGRLLAPKHGESTLTFTSNADYRYQRMVKEGDHE